VPICVIRLPHPLFGHTYVEASRFRLSRTPASVERTAPRIGQDTIETLRDVGGLEPEEIAGLLASGFAEQADDR